MLSLPHRTYSEVSLEAGPYLNLIIGPNGTGKSAIVCGLIIGLAGDISNTGRSGNLSEYVKFGCNNSTIEIELFNPKGENYTIVRKLAKVQDHHENISCTTTWQLDGRKVLKKDIKELVVNKLNISVDNLCQCLPQERVVEFVKMNSKELLKKTQEAIGESGLIHRHEKLCEISKQIKDLNMKFNALSGRTQEDEEVQKRCEEEVKRLKERKALKKQLNLMEAKRAWLEFHKVKQQFAQTKKMIERKKTCLTDLEASFAPSTDARKNFVKEIETIETKLASCKREKLAIIREMKSSSDAVKKLVADERNLVMEFKNALEEDKRRVQTMKELTSEIARCQEELKGYDSLESLKEQKNEVHQELTSVNHEIDKVEAEIDNEERARDAVHRKLRLEQNRLEKESALGRRKQILHLKNDFSYRALQVLEENRGRFRKEIHPPIMLSIDVKEESFVKFVESCFNWRDMFAFVCEDKEDLKTFGALVRTQGLKVAIVMAPDDPISIPTGIPRRLASFGFTHSIADMFDAPPAVKQFLEQQYGISRIPVQVEHSGGESQIEQKINEIKSMNVSRFFSNNTSFRVSTSHYDGETVLTRDAINAPSLLHILNENDQRTQSNINLYKSQLEQHVSRLNELKECKNDFEVQKKELSRKESVIKGRLESATALNNKLQQKKRQLQAKKDAKFDAKTAREELRQQIIAYRKTFEKSMQKFSVTSKKFMDCSKSFSKYQAEKKSLQAKCTALSTLISKFDEQKQRYRDEIRTLQHAADEIKEDAVSARHRATVLSKSKGIALDENNMLTRESRAQFETITSDLEELNAQIGALAMKQASLSGLVNDQAEVDAERRLQAITSNKRLLEQYAGELRSLKDTLATSKEDWINPLKELIEKINVNFEKFMAHMGYAGQVKLSEKGDLFEEYGISIRVKYRSTEQMSELSNFEQSGGERSVATVIYMLALQELSKVPFRCVDEINQGMDATNERKVFDLVVDTAIDNSSQYFLLSPKLLLDLKYNSKMHIHCIHNGPKLDADWVSGL